MQLGGKNVLVVGLAQTGISVAHFLARRGARIRVTDQAARERVRDRIDRLPEGCELSLGGFVEADFVGADLIVMSPGVPHQVEMDAARARGTEVIAEIELGYRFLNPAAHLIAITGTNGKSTTTALCGNICAQTDAPTFCGGNLGNHPFIEAVDHEANTAGGRIVTEVAGFMLENCNSFSPSVGACLNVTPDHLDRYGDFEVYAGMKTRIYQWLRPEAYAICNANDARTVRAATESGARVLAFDSRAEVDGEGAFVDHARAEIVLRLSGSEERYPTADLPIIGNHNLENAMAAYLAARATGVDADSVRQGARTFAPQKHRMELIGRRNDVEFYDDSKGTNVDAVAASLRGFPRPVILIAGGVDKGGSYAPMFSVLKDICRGLVLIGEAAAAIERAALDASADYPVARASSMQDAVRAAAEMARSGDAVVLSPACSSYDMFNNFGERGMAFRDAVATIGAERLD